MADLSVVLLDFASVGYRTAMSATNPVYTTHNTRFAYQLLWSVAVFWKDLSASDAWLPKLQTQCKNAGLRILQHRFTNQCCSLFLLSTRPPSAATEIVRGIKGRLQALVRNDRPDALQRNYDIHSAGSTTRQKTENYVANQLQHHDIDIDRIRNCQLDDLQRYRLTSHGRYRCNLHISLRFQERFLPLSEQALKSVRDVVRSTAEKYDFLLSRIGLLDDHLHLVVGIPATRDPGSVGLSCMNNIAWVFDMQPILRHSGYLGTIGEYDLGAIR